MTIPLRVARWLAPALALAAGSAARAAPPLAIGDVPTADPGTLEVYAGVERVKHDGVEWTVPADELVLGLWSRQELTLEAPWRIEPGGRGLGDLTIGTKVQLLPEAGERPGLAASVEWKLANGSAATGAGSGGQELGLLLRAQKGFGRLTAIANAGYTFVGEPVVGGVRQPRRDVRFLGAGGEVEVTAAASALFDLYWRSADVPGEPARAAADVGFKLQVAPGLQLRGAVGRSVREAALGGPDLRLYLGLRGELPIL